MSLRWNELLSRLNRLQQRIILRVERKMLKVGDDFKCPEGHKAKIVWISEDKKVVAVRCPRKHFDKIVKVADPTKTRLSPRRYPAKEKKIYSKDMFFLIRI